MVESPSVCVLQPSGSDRLFLPCKLVKYDTMTSVKGSGVLIKPGSGPRAPEQGRTRGVLVHASAYQRAGTEQRRFSSQSLQHILELLRLGSPDNVPGSRFSPPTPPLTTADGEPPRWEWDSGRHHVGGAVVHLGLVAAQRERLGVDPHSPPGPPSLVFANSFSLLQV